MKTIFQGGNVISSQVGVFQLVYLAFILCQRSDYGGAIFIDNFLSNVTVYYCSFDRCSTIGSYHGGCMCIRESNQVKLHSVCFHNASAYQCPGFVIWGHLSKRIQLSNVNYTSDCYHNRCEFAGSASFSLGQSLVTKTNFSNLYSTHVPGAGISTGSSQPSVVCEYITFFHIDGNGIVALYPSGSPEYNEIRFINVISCSSSSKLFYSFMSNKCMITKSVFVDVSFTSCYYKYSSGNIELNECYFSNSQSGIDFSNCMITNCEFESSSTVFSHNYLDSNKCWSSITIAKHTIHNYQPFAFSHLIFTIFISMMMM